MSRRSGFSMIELVTTLIIMGVVALMAVPKIDLSRMRSDAGLRQMMTVFVQAQRTALTKQYNVIVSVDVSTGRLRVVEDKNNSNVFDTGDRSYWVALDQGVKFTTSPAALDGLSGTTAFAKPKVLDGYPSLIFRRNGAASSDAAFFISARPSDAGASRAVYVTQSTGRADGYKYSSTGWIRAGI
ncbi:MAG: type II secretion system protein [Gemmatimonadaceae bacterium]|nr:type II secretion system protein [Gemmatimonadaceae bacterium]